MGFEELKQAIVTDGIAPLTEAEAKFRDEQLAAEAALKLVLGDLILAESHLNNKQLPAEWDNIDNLYRAYVKIENWPNTDKARAHLPMPVVMEAVETLMPQLHMAFFSDPEPFLVSPVGKTSPDAARAIGHLLMWAVKESGFKEEIRKCLKSALLRGQLVGKWGWETVTKERKTYKRGDDGKIAANLEEITYQRPTWEYIDLKNVRVASSTRCHDIRTAKAVMHQVFVTADELDSMRDDYKDIPKREELRMILATASEQTEDSMLGSKREQWRENQAAPATEMDSADPLKQPLELLEWTDGHKIITVLQRKIVIRNEQAEFGEINFNSCAFIDVLDSFYGFGVGKLLAGEQSLQAGIVNGWIDSLNLSLNPVWHRKRGLRPYMENIAYAPGKVVSDDGEMEPLQKESMSFEAFQAIQASEARASRRVGANSGPDMPTQAMRTAEGVQQFTAGVQTKLQYFIENFADMVYIPVLEHFIELIKDRLPEQQVRSILSEADAKGYQGEILDLYNSSCSVSVLSSTKLAAKKAMISLVPMIVQIIAAPGTPNMLAGQAKKFNFAEFMTQLLDLAGWKSDDLILDMSEEDQQRAAMSNPAAVNAMAKQQQQQAQQAHDMDMLDAKGDIQVGVQVARHMLKENETPPQAKALALQPPQGGTSE